MIILPVPDAGPSERAALRAALASLDVVVEEVRLGTRVGYVVAGGTDRPAESLARLPHVERVVPLSERASRVAATGKSGARAVRLGPATFGAGHVSVVAGPCTVESPAALAAIAHHVRASGATALRGGVFKVRTSPHAYQGGGLAALSELVAVARTVALPFFTEVNDPRQVPLVAEVVDGLQIGARHMQNFPLLVEAARTGLPVLLKRHMAADVEEWLLAAEYVLDAGNEQVILCERGVKTSDRHVRYMLDLGVVPWLKQRVGLPVIVDPSHAAGHHALVPALARAAIAAGADGLLVEVHPEPASTRCDALQALPPEVFAGVMADVAALAALDGRRLCLPPAPGDERPAACDRPACAPADHATAAERR